MELGRRSMGERMKGAALLQRDVYAEVESDATATGQAAAVVGLVAVAAAIGGVGLGAAGILAGLIATYIAWLAWSATTYLIGDKLLGGTATWGELLRTLGFAQTPGLLFVLGIVPGVRLIVLPIVGIWVFVAGLFALREALDIGFGRVLVTVILGWIVYAILRALGVFIPVL